MLKIVACFTNILITFVSLKIYKMDTFASRLEMLLKMEELSPNQFAEELGIQRSGLTHLLKGRNNPSYDFISKLINLFPNFNIEWLISGKGKPYKDSTALPAPTPEVDDLPPAFSPEEQEFSLFSAPEQTSAPAARQAQDTLFPAEQQEVTEIFEPSQVSENRVEMPSSAPRASQSKPRIARIMVFFEDGTYEER